MNEKSESAAEGLSSEESALDPRARLTAPEDDEHRSKRMLVNKLLLGGFAIFVLGLSTGFFWGPVTVPVAATLTSQQDEESSAPCNALPFEHCTMELRVDERVPRGELLSQSVGPGTVFTTKASGISLVYSAGPAQAVLPELVGLEAKQAASELYKLGFNVGEVAIEDIPEAIPGTVVKTSAEAGEKLANGAVVNLTVASDAVLMPKLVGLSLVEAQILAEDLGLTVVLSGDDDGQAKVVSQFPSVETPVERGSEIGVTASLLSGDSNELKIPELIGLSKEDAQVKLVEAGFRNVTVLEVKNADVNSPQVTQVVPAEGKTVRSDSNVVLVFTSPAN